MTKKKRKSEHLNAEEPLIPAAPGIGGGLSETLEARGSDTPEQDLENESEMNETVRRKRQSIEEGSMDDEHVA
jgi:hypothetical protein